MTSAGYILVADDDEAFLKTVRSLLEKSHYVCDAAIDAHQAAKLLASNEYDLLVSDLEMPGNQNLCLIRDVPQIAAGLPVILMTAYPTVETAIESLQLPVVAYLVKPFEKDVFLTQVQRAVLNYQAFRALHASHRRVQAWHQELSQIQASLPRIPRAEATPWQLLFDLTLRNVSASLADLRVFAESAGPQSTESSSSDKPSPSHPLLLVNALRETINVLEKTKNSFRSKELGELRKKLELLINSAKAEPHAPKSAPPTTSSGSTPP